jgi:hypothetical protein
MPSGSVIQSGTAAPGVVVLDRRQKLALWKEEKARKALVAFSPNGRHASQRSPNKRPSPEPKQHPAERTKQRRQIKDAEPPRKVSQNVAMQNANARVPDANARVPHESEDILQCCAPALEAPVLQVAVEEEQVVTHSVGCQCEIALESATVQSQSMQTELEVPVEPAKVETEVPELGEMRQRYVKLEEEKISLEYANDILLQQIAEVKGKLAKQFQESGTKQAAVAEQNTGEVENWKKLMDSTVSDVQKKMQQVMESSVQKIQQVEVELEASQAEVDKLRRQLNSDAPSAEITAEGE